MTYRSVGKQIYQARSKLASAFADAGLAAVLLNELPGAVQSVTGDGVRLVRCFQLGDLARGEADVHRSRQLFEVRHAGNPHDGCVDRRSGKKPGESDLRRLQVPRFRNGPHHVEYLEICFPKVHLVREGIRLGSAGGPGLPGTGSGQGPPGPRGPTEDTPPLPPNT